MLHADAGTPGLPPFAGGVVGHLAYDAIHRFEPTVPLPDPRPDDAPGPSRFLLVPVVVAFDHVRHRQVIAQPGPGGERDEVTARLTGGRLPRRLQRPPLPRPCASHAGGVRASATWRWWRAPRSTSRAGDIFQVVLVAALLRPTARRRPSPSTAPLRADQPLAVHVLPRGRRRAPSSAPRRRCWSAGRGRHVELRPIAGTRPRGDDADEDARLERELLADPKERAEHVMLVDLGRNDVGRVAARHASQVDRAAWTIERYSHVMHLVSTSQGRLRRGTDAFDALRATLPGGHGLAARPRCAPCRSSTSWSRPARALRRRGGLLRLRRRHGHLHRHPHARDAGRRGRRPGRRRDRGRLGSASRVRGDAEQGGARCVARSSWPRGRRWR